MARRIIALFEEANVDTVVAANNGRELKLSYKGGSKVVTVPANVPPR